MSERTVESTPDQTALVAFLFFVLLGGGASIAVRFTYGELAPFWSGVLRFGAAGIVFWLLMLFRKMPVPKGRALLGAILFGAFGSGLAILFVYYGLTRTPASLYQTVAAIVPLLTLFFAAAHKLEPLSSRGIGGGVLAVVGIAVAVGGSLFSGVEISPPHILAIVAGAACFAEAGIVVKLFPRSHPYATNAVAMTTGALILLVASIVNGEAWTLPTNAGTWLAMIYIVVGATIAGFLLYLFVLSRWTASAASYGFVCVPIVTVILAAILTDENISLPFLVGAAIVISGVYIGALRPTQKPVARPATTEPEVAVEPAMVVPEDIHSRPGVPSCF